MGAQELQEIRSCRRKRQHDPAKRENPLPPFVSKASPLCALCKQRHALPPFNDTTSKAGRFTY